MLIDMPVLPQPRARLMATLLPSPTQASFCPASQPKCSRSVYRSASAWQGWAWSVRPLIDRAALHAWPPRSTVSCFFDAHDDHVDHFAQHAREIGDAFAFAEADIVAQHDARRRPSGSCTPRSSRGFAATASRTTGPSRGPAAAARGCPARNFVFRSSVIAEDPLDFGRPSTSAKVNQVSHRGFSFGGGACWQYCRRAG